MRLADAATMVEMTNALCCIQRSAHHPVEELLRHKSFLQLHLHRLPSKPIPLPWASIQGSAVTPETQTREV